jgi:hypothetical protein
MQRAAARREVAGVEPLIQVLGALLVLTAFVLLQAGRMSSESATYLVLNLVGAGILAVDAALTWQPGFLLLEAVWALVAGWGLARRVLASA